MDSDRDIVIRKADKHDISAMFSISQNSFDIPWSRVSFEAEFLKEHSHSYVCVRDERIIAFITVWVLKDEGEIANLAVSRSYRARGVGSMLLRYVFKKYNLKTWNLEVDLENPEACSLYERNGFTKNRIIKNYYSNGNDAVQMSRKQS